MNTALNATSHQPVHALPDEWVERIFQRMENFYLSLWKDRFGDISRQRVKQAWAEELAGYSAIEIKRGLDTCKTMKFPPTLPEFLLACRPPIDYEGSYHHAISQMHNRRNGEPDRWNHKAIYWAAASLGADLMQPYATIKGRWKSTLDEFMDEPVLPEIPAPMIELPAPGQQTAAPEVVKAASETLKKMTAKPRNSMQHWRDIRDKHHAGLSFPQITLQYYREALANMGEQFEKPDDALAAAA